MFKFSRKVEYALTAMVAMSQKKQRELTTARELADHFHLSLELIGKILQALARNNLITSVQGVKGGYYIPHSIDSIFISDILSAVDEPIRLVRCGHEKRGLVCERQQCCLIRNSMLNIQMKIVNFFRTMTLRDFTEKYSKTDL